MRLTNVVLRGYVPKEQTLSVMKAANCALITLQDFALGVISPSKLHANLAMGLPVTYVGPPRSNVDEAIETFDCGISLRHGQTQELVEYIRRLARSPRLALEATGRARQAFETAYCDVRTLSIDGAGRAQLSRFFAAVIDRKHRRKSKLVPARRDSRPNEGNYTSALNRSSKYSIVRLSPSSSWTRGAQPIVDSANATSGRRVFGSSVGSSR